MNEFSYEMPDYSTAIRDDLTPVYQKMILDIQIEQIDRIKKRTDKGLNVDGIGFKDYAKSTIRKKKRTQKQTSPVNLRQTDLMMNQMYAHKETDFLAVVGFNDASYSDERGSKAPTVLEIAGYHNEGDGKIPKREFFGYSKQDENDYQKMFETITFDALNDYRHI